MSKTILKQGYKIDKKDVFGTTHIGEIGFSKNLQKTWKQLKKFIESELFHFYARNGICAIFYTRNGNFTIFYTKQLQFYSTHPTEKEKIVNTGYLVFFGYFLSFASFVPFLGRILNFLICIIGQRATF